MVEHYVVATIIMIVIFIIFISSSKDFLLSGKIASILLLSLSVPSYDLYLLLALWIAPNGLTVGARLILFDTSIHHLTRY